MGDGRTPLTKLINRLYRCTQSYANEVLAKYGLGSGTYPFLLTLAIKEGINQNQISRELNIDKAMSARAIKRLIQMGYIKKEGDKDDTRAFKLFLTDKARAVIPEVKEELRKWNERITKDLSEAEKNEVLNLLGKILENAQSCSNKW